jgi:predicted CxxxxCH...CXXCH cytochrome family protein
VFAGFLAAALTACGGKVDAPGAAKPTARGSHAAIAAPGASTQCAGSDVHQRHLSLFACDTCHPSGAAFGFTKPYVFPHGTSTTNGTVVVRTATTPTTCTVACHYPMGGAARSVTWDTPGPLACTACHDPAALPDAHPPVAANSTRADCQGCHTVDAHLGGAVTLVAHPSTFTDPTSADFHAVAANRGLAACQSCHARDLTGGAAKVGCGSCHDKDLPPGVASWKANCIMCHGRRDDGTGAPPAAIWGQAGDPARGGGTADPVRVGAHAAHLAGSAIAPPFDCGVCHVKPTDALAPGHIDTVTGTDVPLASVTFGGVATKGLADGVVPAWDRTTGTCSNTYCHGATVSGGTLRSPDWTTVDGSQAACGTCHGVPPPPPHAAVDVTAGLQGCNPCHAGTIDGSGALIAPSAGGQHLDGIIEATGGHVYAWMDQASPSFHAYAANQGLAACQGCHGASLDGVGGMTAIGCAQCHGASWKTNCTMCHGDVALGSAAPPRATWGHDAPADPTNVRIGAHQSHLHATHGLTKPLDCTACHARPASALTATHVDGIIEVTGYTGTDPKLLAAVKDPAFSVGDATCATSYCHGGGGVLTDGTLTRPTWTTVDGSQAACGTCHGLPPRSSWGHGYHFDCQRCHLDVATYDSVTKTVKITNPARHMNGVVDIPAYLTGQTLDLSQAPPTCVDCHSGL